MRDAKLILLTDKEFASISERIEKLEAENAEKAAQMEVLIDEVKSLVRGIDCRDKWVTVIGAQVADVMEQLRRVEHHLFPNIAPDLLALMEIVSFEGDGKGNFELDNRWPPDPSKEPKK